MEFVYYISEKECDGNEHRISLEKVQELIPYHNNSLQKLQDGHVIQTDEGVIWAEEA